MARIDKASVLGREPLNIVELDLDFCSHTFGTSPCTATGEKCYNTYTTCQDKSNYTAGTKTYRFTDKDAVLPVGQKMFPASSSISFSPTKLEYGKGLGYRGKCSISLKDFKHSDNDIDPYLSDRTHDTSSGSFFTKLLARNTYYNGRTVRVLSGYNGKVSESSFKLYPSLTTYPSGTTYLGGSGDSGTPFDIADFDKREYLIENISIDRNNNVRITGKDILKKLDSDRTKVPLPTTGVLKADILSTDISLTLTDASFDEYATSGHIRINDEIISYTGKTAPDTLTGLTRGQYGTTASGHSIDDEIQQCKVYDTVNIVDIIYDLLVNYGGIDASFIPYGAGEEWEVERDTYLSYANYSTVISEPEGVASLLEELTEQSMLMLWWDERQQLIRLKALTPPTQRYTVRKLKDSTDFIEGSVSVKYLENMRYTQLWVRSYPKDWTQLDEDKNYGRLYIGTNLDLESDIAYGDARIKQMNSRWFSQDAQSVTLYSRFSSIFSEPPIELKAKIDAKNLDISIGDIIDVETRQITDYNGNAKTLRVFVTEMKESEIGHSIEITVLSTGFLVATGLRYGYITPNTMVDYTSATSSQKAQYGFIAPDTGVFVSDSGEAYKIIGG